MSFGLGNLTPYQLFVEMFETTTLPEMVTDVYDIAAVCRLTGLSAPNLRMWEKRYQAVVPGRSETGRRQYVRSDIKRLTLLKALSDHGHGIRSIVGLPIVELEKRLEECARGKASAEKNENSPPEEKGRACRLVVVGAHLSALLDHDRAFPPGAIVVREYVDLDAPNAAENVVEADLLLLEIPALFSEDLIRVRRLIGRFRALRAIIVYAYARRETIEDIGELGGLITAIRGPVSLAELRNACAADVTMANRSSAAVLENAPGPRCRDEEIPERQYSQRQLARISNTPATVECECPHHLAGILEALNNFEKYSALCEDRNEADAKIHAYLHRMTAHARATMEDALKVLVEFEDFEVGEF